MSSLSTMSSSQIGLSPVFQPDHRLGGMSLGELQTGIREQLKVVVALDILKMIVEYARSFQGVVQATRQLDQKIYPDSLIELNEGRIGCLGPVDLHIYNPDNFNQPLYVVEDCRPSLRSLYLKSTQQLLCVNSLSCHPRKLYRLGDARVESVALVLQNKWDIDQVACLKDGQLVCILNTGEVMIVPDLQSGSSYQALQTESFNTKTVHPLEKDKFALVDRTSIQVVDLNGDEKPKLSKHPMPSLVANDVIDTQAWERSIVYLYRPRSRKNSSIIGMIDLADEEPSYRDVKHLDERVTKFIVTDDGYCIYPTCQGLVTFALDHPEEKRYCLADESTHWGEHMGPLTSCYLKAFSDRSIVVCFGDKSLFRWV